MQKTIGQASLESGIGIETIRYYEKEGIIPSTRRGSNGRRQFNQSDISRLKFIKRFRSLGFSIHDIRSLQSLAFSKDNSCEKAASIGERNLEIVKAKISELHEIEGALIELIRQCETNPEKCPMLAELQSTIQSDDNQTMKYRFEPN